MERRKEQKKKKNEKTDSIILHRSARLSLFVVCRSRRSLRFRYVCPCDRNRSFICLFVFSSEIRKVSSVSAIGSRLVTVGKVRGGGERVKGKKKQVQGDGGARPEVITGMR